MHVVAKVFLGAAVLWPAMARAHGQGLGTNEIGKVSVNDPPGPMPDPTHIPFMPPDNIKWEGNPAAEQTSGCSAIPASPACMRNC